MGKRNFALGMTDPEVRQELIRYTKLLAREGLISGSEGNLSVRMGRRMLLTPQGVVKAELSEEDLAEVDLSGEVLSGSPSSELPMHLALYWHFPEIGAVVHTHPPYTLALSLSGYDFKDFPLVEGEILLKRVKFVPYAPPGSRELAEKIKEAAGESPILVLERHGVVTLGASLLEALNLNLILEKVCKVTYLYFSLRRQKSE